jgi:hypothetical protein
MAVVKDEWMYEQDIEYNRILGQTTGLLAQRGVGQDCPVVAPLASIAAGSWEITRIREPSVPALGGDCLRPRPGGCRLGRCQAEVGA